MRLILTFLIAALPLSGCMTSASIGSERLTATPVAVDGHLYHVYRHRDENRAEAHRVDFVVPPPSRVEVLQGGYKAIIAATGCKIPNGSLDGDQAIVTAKLDCS
ncbi:hypothetical protein [Celeribacter sp.]|uniref:hypothetical protein n=1 Tax=Celeribacter sp. TaxID=1890673 RepID=UPI003A8DD9DA